MRSRLVAVSGTPDPQSAEGIDEIAPRRPPHQDPHRMCRFRAQSEPIQASCRVTCGRDDLRIARHDALQLTADEIAPTWQQRAFVWRRVPRA